MRNLIGPAVVICCLAAAPAGIASAAVPTYFKPGTYKGKTTQGLPVSFKASKTTGISRFRVEIEVYCYAPAPPGSADLYVLERSFRETFKLRRTYGFGVTTRRRNFFRFSEQPDANTTFSSESIFLKGKRSHGDLFVSRAQGETECAAARRDTATGEFTELTPSFDIRRRK